MTTRELKPKDYIATIKGVPTPRIVRSYTKAAAHAHVSADVVTVEMATGADMYEAGQLGVEIEDLTEDEPEQGAFAADRESACGEVTGLAVSSGFLAAEEME